MSGKAVTAVIRRHRKFFILAVFLVAAILLGLWFPAAGRKKLAEDPNAVNVPRASPVDEKMLQEALQAQADAESFRVRINSRPAFGADGEGDLLLQNPQENTRSLQVTVTLDETGKEVYQSEVIPPGGQELRVTLSYIPKPGKYEATAGISVIDPATGDAVGSMTAALCLIIEE